MSVKEKVATALELPKDIVMDLPKITMMGEKELAVENYKGIIEYGERVIRLNTSKYMLKITGEGLEIKNITKDEIELMGTFAKLEFL